MCGKELLGGGLHSPAFLVIVAIANVSSKAAYMWIFLFSQRENEEYLVCFYIQMLQDLNTYLNEFLAIDAALIISHIITSAQEEYMMASIYLFNNSEIVDERI